MNTPTPRTDDQIGYAGSTMTMVRIDFARQLERELAEAKQQNETAAQAAFEAHCEIMNDRDEWKAIATTLFSSYATPSWEQAVERFLAKKGQQ